MPKKPKKPITAKSIWFEINKRIKEGKPLKTKEIEKQIKNIEYYIDKGGEILDIFDEWVDDQKSLMEKHTKKLEGVKARLLAEVI